MKRLTNEKYCTTYLKESQDGPPRKYYHLSVLGEEALNTQLTEWLNFVEKVNEFVKEIVFMNKQEFLNQLREKLHVLNDEELEALIQEYDETINDAMADGKSEEEAVASFGDLDELVRELLDAYKLRQPQQKKSVDFAEEGKKP